MIVTFSSTIQLAPIVIGPLRARMAAFGWTTVPVSAVQGLSVRPYSRRTFRCRPLTCAYSNMASEGEQCVRLWAGQHGLSIPHLMSTSCGSVTLDPTSRRSLEELRAGVKLGQRANKALNVLASAHLIRWTEQMKK